MGCSRQARSLRQLAAICGGKGQRNYAEIKGKNVYEGYWGGVVCVVRKKRQFGNWSMGKWEGGYKVGSDLVASIVSCPYLALQYHTPMVNPCLVLYGYIWHIPYAIYMPTHGNIWHIQYKYIITCHGQVGMAWLLHIACSVPR